MSFFCENSDFVINIVWKWIQLNFYRIHQTGYSIKKSNINKIKFLFKKSFLISFISYMKYPRLFSLIFAQLLPIFLICFPHSIKFSKNSPIPFYIAYFSCEWEEFCGWTSGCFPRDIRLRMSSKTFLFVVTHTHMRMKPSNVFSHWKS